jgi:hypothetical protein
MAMNENFKRNSMAMDEKSILDPTWPKWILLAGTLKVHSHLMLN